MKRFLLALAMMAGGLVISIAVPTPVASAASGRTSGGYWMMTAAGQVYGFGGAESGRALTMGGSAVHIVPTSSGDGWWALSSTGWVSTSGNARYLGSGSNATLTPGETFVSMSATPNDDGYWLFTNRGRAIPFGTAQHYGDMSSFKLNGPVLGSVATPDGHGYYMVGSDGGIFTFGNAAFRGSTGNIKLNKPVMSMAPDPDGAGYWLVASDGGIFAFDAPFYGSTGGMRLNKPISGMVTSPTGGGYLMVASDGGTFAFGDVPFYGSLGGSPPASPVVAIAAIAPPSGGSLNGAGPGGSGSGPAPAAPAPVTEMRQVVSNSGTKGTDTALFAMGGGAATMTWSCQATGSYTGGCYFAVRDLASGSALESWMPDANTSGTTYLHPDAGGWYYVDVDEFNTGTTAWSFTITQETCIANCPAGQAAPTAAPSWVTMTQKSGTTKTDTAPFNLWANPAKMEWSCQGSGSYAGGCYFAVKDMATGSTLESWMPDAGTTGTKYLHPKTAGQYYVAVDEFNTDATAWSFTITQMP